MKIFKLPHIFVFAFLLSAQVEAVAEGTVEGTAKPTIKCTGPFLKTFYDFMGHIGYDFSISQDQLMSARKQVNMEIINTSLFVIPNNDGEAKRAVQILKALGAPYLHVSQQAWGATLDKEKINPWVLEEVKKIVIFEIPGVEEEENLRAQGLEVIVIDHHAYKDLDRRRSDSSLEQLAALINWPMSRADEAIAVNDRGYIPGLKELGLSNQEIYSVRQFDLLAQGYSATKLELESNGARAHIPAIPKRGQVFILKDLPIIASIVKQELAIQSDTGVVSVLELGKKYIGFSGDPNVVRRLLDLKFEDLGYEEKSFSQYGGGDSKASMFFGFKPTKPPKGEQSLIPDRVLEKILNEVDAAVKE